MNFEKEIEKVAAPTLMVTSQNMDCETAALLRAVIRPLFASAVTWAGLADSLREKGYRLAFQSGRMCLMDLATGARLCGLRFLDIELLDLVRRLGRPVVVARGDSADGELLRARPSADGS
ncbi:hypothetical protein SAMN05444279_103128 [Ruegeria intermedia]|uniref:Uncharacterized protein n=2 Tax=Ruegeria intermedia TaxID=996115 RepID=A0A1M4U1U8_9RHOB|nr:hypothetical protein SAMN05444279_103128 [Ruegeria intermedia]